MILNLFHYIMGTITFRVRGPMPEKFINLCITHKKRILSISKKDEDLIVSMILADFFTLRPLVRKSQNHIRVIQYAGFPFVIKKIKRRKMLVVGGIGFIFLLNVLMSYIWFIDIVGNQFVPVGAIAEVLGEQGLKLGALKEQMDSKKIENQILIRFPEIAWASVQFTGTRAVVEIVEKTIPKNVDKTPAHIIAAKDGMITEVIALVGESIVKKGDTVKKGDLLIKGIPQTLRAKGIVNARVWYEGYSEAGLTHVIYERTGEKQYGVKVRIGDHIIVLKKVVVPSDQLFEMEEVNKKLPSWRNRDISVECIMSTYYEVHKKNVELTVEEARDQAKKKALAELQTLIPETALILSRSIEVLETLEKNLVRVRVNIETAEDIGQFMDLQ